MKISEKYLNSITCEDSINLMQTTSRNATRDIREIYNSVNGKENNLLIAVYGSLARYEMLPMSDMDILLFSNDKKLVNTTKELLKKLKFDYLDFLSENFINLDNLKQFALSNSPDGHVSKFHIIDGNCNSEIYKQLISIRDTSNNPYLLLENLIFDYNYFNYRAKQKFNPLGENLKYSKGGTRDFVYFDWAGDFITNGKVSEQSRINEAPQIIYSIPIICKYLGKEMEQNDLLSAINFVNNVKNQALLLKKQGGHFDGLMSIATAKELLYNYNYKNIASESELIEIHKSARNMIFNYREMLYEKILSNLRLRVNISDECMRLVNIAGIWSGKSTDYNEIINNFSDDVRWSDVATIICQDGATRK